MAFRFKQFSIEDDQSSMKVGTDAVLLGAWTNPNQAQRILDIGCGSAVISIMIAQKTNALITGIEIDKESAEQASQNCRSSKWSDRLNIIHSSFQSYCLSPQKFDLIVSNPPFFNNSLKSPNQSKTNSKHTVLLSFQELLMGTKRLLQEDGVANFILPYSELEFFKTLATIEGLFINRILLIKPKPNKEINRCILSLQHSPSKLVEDLLCIRNSDSSYSDDYKFLTSKFYLNF